MTIGLLLLAGAIFLVAAVAIAIWGVMRPQPFAVLGADEITAYTSERFLCEADLWRVHLRSLHGLEQVTREAQEDGNVAARAVVLSLYSFLAGLGFSLVSLGTLIFELI